MDTEIWDHYLALLFEKNLVVVYDLKRSKVAKGESSAATANGIQFNRPVFKAHFADATDHITQLFFIKDFQLLMKLYFFFLFSLIIISPHSTNNSTNNRLITNHQMTPRQTLP